MRRRWAAALGAAFVWIAGTAGTLRAEAPSAPAAPADATPVPDSVLWDALAASGWSAAAGEFRVQLHALAGEALVLQLSTPALEPPRGARAARKLRWDAQDRLAESLRAANGLLSMLEIAETSDRGPRVREVLALWIRSSRASLTDHLEKVGAVSDEAPMDASTAAFLEELKILWKRLDAAYAALEAALADPSVV